MKTAPLAGGEHSAVCRERNVISVAANGHSLVFPKARMTLKDGWAFFRRDGVEIWSCNASYAEAQFDVHKA
ncbi:hypothetical protein QZM50_34090 [Burkholderia gladioli]|nr:hypothetical protein [Burkholderia gladioli]MDN7465754.1 hypothetical protein [Burkholderia gladioli]MDN7812922.1 hypothetical protein [Burkholderia gladioli]PRE10760.1 hypothetical protein C6P72_34590 [Burkholderia gladioli]